MALKKPRKVTKKPVTKKVKTRVTPKATALTPLTDKQMTTRATELTNAALKPRMNDIDALSRITQGQHDTRNAQIQGWGNWQQGNLDKAFADTSAALNNLIATQGNVDAANRDSLMAALRAGTGSTDAAAQTVGTPTPTDVSGLAGSSADASKSTQMSVGQGAAGLLGYMGAQRELAGIGLQQNAEVERQRHNAQQFEISSQRKALEDERSGIQAKNMQDLRDFELSKAQLGETKASNLFQQYLAEQELGLKKKDQSFQQWLATKEVNLKADAQNLERQKFLHGVQIDWQNVAISKKQVEAQLAGIAQDAANAKTEGAREKAKLRGEAMARGYEWLSGFLAPEKGQTSSTHREYPYGPATVDSEGNEVKEYQRMYVDALRGLQQFVSKSDALRMLSNSPYSHWAKRARSELAKLKRRPTKKSTPAKKANLKPDFNAPKLTRYPQTKKKPKKNK